MSLFNTAADLSKLGLITSTSSTQTNAQSEGVPLSIIILTKNEEKFIERCIRSVDWADEKLVLDSGSTDRTREIASSLGATVYEQAWLGWTPQRMKGISLAKHDWVLVLEADEIVDPELARSIQVATLCPKDDRNGYYFVRRHDMHGALIPNMRRKGKEADCVRLFNRKHSFYDPNMLIHEEVRIPGKPIFLEGTLLHWRGYMIGDNIAVINRNAVLEAQMLHDRGVRATGSLIFVRPILRFLWCYIRKGSFRVGVPGLNYAMSRAVADYICYVKLWEIQNIPQPIIHPPVEVYEHSSLVVQKTFFGLF